jgi:hypothetical protein
MQISRVSPRATVVGGMVVLACLVGLTLTITAQQRGGSQPSLKGVWRYAEATTSGADARTITFQPGFVFFGDKYFSMIQVIGDKARPELPSGPFNELPDKPIADAARAFAARAGTYEIVGGELRTKHLVAMSPNQMKAGAFTNYTFKLDGNTLWLTVKDSSGAPRVSGPDVANGLGTATTKLTHVE